MSGTNPEAWPQCERCGTAYVYRRCLSLRQGWVWVWQQDCEKPRSTCKGAKPVLVDADGPLDDSRLAGEGD